MKTSNLLHGTAAAFVLSFTLVTFAPLGNAQTLEVLHSFQGSDGGAPHAELVQGNDGNFYGTTERGGDLSQLNGVGAGTVFKMTTNGMLTTLVSFNSSNGRFPHGLVQGSDDNFYGTTSSGGNLSLNSGNGYGTVFKMEPDGTLTTLVRFNGTNGAYPEAALVQGSDGNLYGTCPVGGAYNKGTVFRVVMPPALPRLDIARNGNEIVLSWPASAAGFGLETAESLTPSMNWTPVSEIPTITGDQNTIAVSDPRGRRFYRLRRP